MLIFIFLFNFTIINSLYSNIQYNFEFENSLTFVSYNKIKIPGDTGTLISFNDNFTKPSFYSYRLRQTINLYQKHNISILYAPLSFNTNSVITKDITFNDEVFNKDTKVYLFYKFNSYRITYNYEFYNKNKFKISSGLTLKIRDAEIKLYNNNTNSYKKNIGFVPLINFNLNYLTSSNLLFIFDFDALAAPQGRAEDLRLGFKYLYNKYLNLILAYRLLEGGANNDKVYNFTAIHYLSFGFELVF